MSPAHHRPVNTTLAVPETPLSRAEAEEAAMTPHFPNRASSTCSLHIETFIRGIEQEDVITATQSLEAMCCDTPPAQLLNMLKPTLEALYALSPEAPLYHPSMRRAAERLLKLLAETPVTEIKPIPCPPQKNAAGKSGPKTSTG